MTVINSSFVSLVRVRKQLQKAYDEGNWDDVRHWDVALADLMNEAFDDEDRNTTALVDELQKVLNLYTKIVSELPENSAPKVAPPRSFRE